MNATWPDKRRVTQSDKLPKGWRGEGVGAKMCPHSGQQATNKKAQKPNKINTKNVRGKEIKKNESHKAFDF